MRGKCARAYALEHRLDLQIPMIQASFRNPENARGFHCATDYPERFGSYQVRPLKARIDAYHPVVWAPEFVNLGDWRRSHGAISASFFGSLNVKVIGPTLRGAGAWLSARIARA